MALDRPGAEDVGGVPVTNATPPSDSAVRVGRHRARRERRNPGRPADHGFYALDRTLRVLGSRAIDGGSAVAKQLAAWRADLIRDLGGDPSTQQLAVIQLATRTKLLLDSIDAWLLTQPSLVDAEKKALLPVAIGRHSPTRWHGT
jgi:hypothetical protein